jgi:hypothetical protein
MQFIPGPQSLDALVVRQWTLGSTGNLQTQNCLPPTVETDYTRTAESLIISNPVEEESVASLSSCVRSMVAARRFREM